MGCCYPYESSGAADINASGLIVGSGYKVTGVSKEPLGPIYMDSRAYLYSNGRWVDLNGLVNLKGSGLSNLWDASGINDSGQIIGKAMSPGAYHAYLLTPIANRAKRGAGQ
jgi:hypothetical protein